MNRKFSFPRKRKTETEEAVTMEENQEASVQDEAKDSRMQQEIALEIDAGTSQLKRRTDR